MFYGHFYYVFKIVPFSFVFNGITFVSTCHMCCISIVRSLYFRSSLTSFVPWNCNVYLHTCSFFIITYYDARFFLRKGSVSEHLLIPLDIYLNFTTRSTNFGTLSYQRSFFIYAPVSLNMLNAVEHTLYHITLRTVLLPSLDMLI